MPRIVRIGLLFHYAFSFSRDVLRGLRRFAEARPDWVFVPVLPGRRGVQCHGKIVPDALLATVDNPTFIQALRTWKRPIVNVSSVLKDLPYPRVGLDGLAVGRLAAEHLLTRGVRHFAFVGRPQHQFSEECEQAYGATLREAGYEVVCYHTRKNRQVTPSGPLWCLDRRIHTWLLALAKPLGVFVTGDLLGAELAAVCQQHGVRVPEDVALVGVSNDDLFCDLARPPLSSVIVNAERVGYEAGALLDRVLAGKKPSAQLVLVPPSGVQVRRSSEVLAIDDQDVATAARFIYERAHLPITVADVLGATLVGRRSLERRFQRMLGHGVAEEIRRTRLAHCKRLLAGTDFDMPAVARHSGFSSARHLATAFRREFGMTPSEFRKRTRASAPP